jgi:hypothetical protein
MDAAGQLCSRARFWSSLRVDDELSELEGALLDAHVARCSGCREFAASLDASTAVLRGAPSAGHASVVLDLRRAPGRFVVGAGIAALIAAAAIAGGIVRGTSTPASTNPSPGLAVAVISSADTPDELRRLRRTTLLNERPLPRDVSGGEST